MTPTVTETSVPTTYCDHCLAVTQFRLNNNNLVEIICILRNLSFVWSAHSDLSVCGKLHIIYWVNSLFYLFIVDLFSVFWTIEFQVSCWTKNFYRAHQPISNFSLHFCNFCIFVPLCVVVSQSHSLVWSPTVPCCSASCRAGLAESCTLRFRFLVRGLCCWLFNNTQYI